MQSSFNIRIPMLLVPQLTPQLHLLHEKSAFPPFQWIVDRTLTPGENEQIVHEGPEQSTDDICYPRTPDPPCVLPGEEFASVAGHQGKEAWAEVSGGIEATTLISMTARNKYGRGW